MLCVVFFHLWSHHDQKHIGAVLISGLLDMKVQFLREEGVGEDKITQKKRVCTMNKRVILIPLQGIGIAF